MGSDDLARAAFETDAEGGGLFVQEAGEAFGPKGRGRLGEISVKGPSIREDVLGLDGRGGFASLAGAGEADDSGFGRARGEDEIGVAGGEPGHILVGEVGGVGVGTVGNDHVGDSVHVYVVYTGPRQHGAARRAWGAHTQPELRAGTAIGCPDGR